MYWEEQLLLAEFDAEESIFAWRLDHNERSPVSHRGYTPPKHTQFWQHLRYYLRIWRMSGPAMILHAGDFTSEYL